MLKVSNRLRILGTIEEVKEMKAFLENSKGDEKSSFDLTKVTSSFKEKVEEISEGYDRYDFKTDKPVLDTIIELSKRFSETKLAYQYVSMNEKDDKNLTLVEQEKAHYLLLNGEITSESKSSTKHARTKKYETAKMIESKPDDTKEKNELVSRDSLFSLQEKFFKDIQDFMKDFTDSFLNHWF
jgi:hypothetical protein